MKKMEVHLHTNSDCNLHCIHCYNYSGERNSDLSKEPSDEYIINSLIYICGNYDAEIHLEGGEIFLRPELLKKMDSLSDDILKRITITTNGTILNRDKTVLHMLRRVAVLRVSVESANAAVHSRIRGYSLQSVTDHAKEYQINGVPVCIRITLNKLNYDHFIHNNIIKLSEKGFKTFQVYEFQRVGRGIDNCSLLTLDDSLRDLINELCSTPMHGISLKMMFPKRRISEILRSQQKLIQADYKTEVLTPDEGISIHTDGNVYACAWENDPQTALFNWYDDHNARRIINTRKILHECEYCTAIKITSLS